MLEYEDGYTYDGRMMQALRSGPTNSRTMAMNTIKMRETKLLAQGKYMKRDIYIKARDIAQNIDNRNKTEDE